jgi:hypothetical protein
MARMRLAVLVDDGIAGDPVNPALQPAFVTQARDARVNLH